MQQTIYNSIAGSKSFSISDANWREFSKYVSRHQWAFDSPSYSPRKSEITHAIVNRGKPGACTFHREDGGKFILRPMHAWAFEQAKAKGRKIYYVSWGQQALLYFDIDLHHAWQTQAEGEEARRLIQALLTRFFGRPVLFWAPSSRGVNGYLKVNLHGMDPETANGVFARLEKALQRFLAFYENLADFEVKGRMGYMRDGEYRWAQYGKLPVHCPDWNFAKLDEFKSKPLVSIRRLEVLCQEIESQVSPDILERHKARKKQLGEAPASDGKYFLVTPEMEEALLTKHGECWRCMFAMRHGDEESTWLPLKYYRPGEIPITEWELREAQNPLPDVTPVEENPQPPPIENAPSPKTPFKINLGLADLMHEPDSFLRQRQALLEYARYLKRVPTLEEALGLIRTKRLFTGTWDDHLAKRKARLRSILQFISQTFDASKCAKGSVNIGKYDSWAAHKFPKGIIWTKKRLTEYGNAIDGQQIHVGPKFIAVFMAISEFALLTNKNQDNTLPHNRGQELWNELYARGLISVRFCARKWAACREEMNRCGVIKITNREYHPGKAMEWETGNYFPGLGLWKGKKQDSFGIPLRMRKRRTTRGHNTLLCKQPVKSQDLMGLARSRPPPADG